MDKYPEFLQLKTELDNHNIDYQKDVDILLAQIARRRNGYQFSIQEHIEALVFSELSSNRPWQPIADNRQNIKNLFHDFDPDYIELTSAEHFITELKNLKCGNRQIHSQMNTLPDNTRTLRKIAKDFGSIDTYYNNKDVADLVCDLALGTDYKLKYLGIPLVAEYLKSVGVDVMKPDIHLCRILFEWGYCDENYANSINKKTFQKIYGICSDIAQTFSITIAEVDAIIWRGGESGLAYRLNNTAK